MYFSRMLEEGSGQGGVGWLVWVALAIFFVMVFLGWWVSSRGLLKKEAEPVQAEHGHVEQRHSKHGHVQQAVAAPIHAPVADDLTLLEGIGPKVAKVLAGIGITTFDGLAKADHVKVKAALDAAGYKYMDPKGWFDQAVLAAKGDKDGLKKLQDSLKGGRKVA